MEEDVVISYGVTDYYKLVSDQTYYALNDTIPEDQLNNNTEDIEIEISFEDIKNVIQLIYNPDNDAPSIDGVWFREPINFVDQWELYATVKSESAAGWTLKGGYKTLSKNNNLRLVKKENGTFPISLSINIGTDVNTILKIYNINPEVGNIILPESGWGDWLYEGNNYRVGFSNINGSTSNINFSNNNLKIDSRIIEYDFGSEQSLLDTTWQFKITTPEPITTLTSSWASFVYGTIDSLTTWGIGEKQEYTKGSCGPIRATNFTYGNSKNYLCVTTQKTDAEGNEYIITIAPNTAEGNKKDYGIYRYLYFILPSAQYDDNGLPTTSGITIEKIN